MSLALNVNVSAAPTKLVSTSIYEVLTTDAGAPRLTVIAESLSLTCVEWAAAGKAAAVKGATTDKADGFEPDADAKGTAKYGPHEMSVRTGFSMMAQIFGAAKLGFVAVENYTWAEALCNARLALAHAGVRWNGKEIKDATERAASKALKAEALAYGEVKADNPMIEDKDIMAAVDEKKTRNAADALVAAIEKAAPDVAILACLTFLANHGTISEHIAALESAK